MRNCSTSSTLSDTLHLAGLIGVTLCLAGCQMGLQEWEPLPVQTTELDVEPARIVCAFYGLDNALPPRAVKLSLSAPGRDGMPVTFSRRVDGPIDPNAFTVVTRSGARVHPLAATLKPADSQDKRHTVLLIGELGDEPDDPPITVEITGSILLEGGVDAKGLTAPVTPLADGPTIVLAYPAKPAPDAGDEYPEGTKQVIVVVWAGGVRPLPDTTPEDHRLGYTVTNANGDMVPIGIGSLGDGDNYEHLYLDTTDTPLRVSMNAGLLMDPRDDPNPKTDAPVERTVSAPSQ